MLYLLIQIGSLDFVAEWFLRFRCDENDVIAIVAYNGIQGYSPVAKFAQRFLKSLSLPQSLGTGFAFAANGRIASEAKRGSCRRPDLLEQVPFRDWKIRLFRWA